MNILKEFKEGTVMYTRSYGCSYNIFESDLMNSMNNKVNFGVSEIRYNQDTHTVANFIYAACTGTMIL